MAKFSYRAKAKDGSIRSGTIEAASLDLAIDILQKNQLVVINIRPVREGGILSITIGTPIKAQDIVNFARQISVMFSSKVSLVEALNAIATQTENKKLRSIIYDLAKDVEAGLSLSKALAKHPKIFGHFFISMVKSGEASGKLEEVFNYLADYTEREYDLRQKAKSAMIYPAFVLGGLILATIVLLVFVVPQISAVLEESGQELPAVTLAIIGLSEFFQQFWWLVLIIIFGLILSLWYYVSKTAAGRNAWDRLKIRAPVFGKIFQKVYLARMAESLSTLIVGGVPITQALETSSEVVGNKVYHDILIEAVGVVKKGQPINRVFHNYPKVVPPMVSQMMAVGESTGRLELVLRNVASFYNKDVERTMANLVSLIEPILILILGVGVAILIISILVPMYNIATSF